MAGIRCAVLSAPYDLSRFSRRVSERLPYSDPWEEAEAVVDSLVAYARREGEAPVLMPQGDGDLLAVSRHRERLARDCAVLLADTQLVEDLVDKARFLSLAERLALPVPPARRLRPWSAGPAGHGLRFPVIVKPLLRNPDLWQPYAGRAKGVAVEGQDELERLWERLAESERLEVLVQEAVPGAETRVESYHVYVGADGSVVAEFTGRKIRTSPATYGHSTALETTWAPDVTALGREVIERLQLIGVAKADFKRAPDGSLHLLEVNPRFTLWHHPAAVAGLNIPALVHADLTGGPRPAVRPVPAGVTWCLPLSDFRIAVVERRDGLGDWLRFLTRCDAISGFAPDDPLPLVPGTLVRAIGRRLQRRFGAS